MQTPLPPQADVRPCKEAHADRIVAEDHEYRIEALRIIITERSLFLTECSPAMRKVAENNLAAALGGREGRYGYARDDSFGEYELGASCCAKYFSIALYAEKCRCRITTGI
jgi:hypothetical protein